MPTIMDRGHLVMAEMALPTSFDSKIVFNFVYRWLLGASLVEGACCVADPDFLFCARNAMTLTVFHKVANLSSSP